MSSRPQPVTSKWWMFPVQAAVDRTALSALAWYLLCWGRQQLAIELAQLACAAGRALTRRLNIIDESTLTAINGLSVILRAFENRSQAAILAEEAFKGREILLGAEHPATLCRHDCCLAKF